MINVVHCSPGYGMMTDGTTTFINASACTVNFMPMNAPIIFDLPNPRTSTWHEEAPPKTPAGSEEKDARWGDDGGGAESDCVKIRHKRYDPRDGTD